MWWLLSCTFTEPAPDVVYGGGSLWGEFIKTDPLDEGPDGPFEIAGTESPGDFDFEACEEGAAARLGNNEIHQEVVACFHPDDMPGFFITGITRGFCGTDAYDGLFTMRFVFDNDGTSIYTIEPVATVAGSPEGSLDAWSMSELTMNEVETLGMRVDMTHIDWVIMGVEEDCEEHLGILGRGTAWVQWAFDEDVQAAL